MKLVVLYGRPAVGKLTVGQELAKQSGWRLFHNHLIVDALLAVFEFGSASFVELRERMWLDVFLHASSSGVAGLIFTFSPENTVRQEFITRLVADARARGDTVHLVELTCSDADAERRLVAASRQSTGKLTSLELYRNLKRDRAFDRPIMPPSDFSIATDGLLPSEAAQQIWLRVRG